MMHVEGVGDRPAALDGLQSPDGFLLLVVVKLGTRPSFGATLDCRDTSLAV
jgi:hypothetical protein